ncbi:MAG TPA: DUF6152 family protein [Vicinamibacterales bacterium]|jgi:hypothetical protein|nr:DUF6152 family protein [Vicinamibacterales bacterium]
MHKTMTGWLAVLVALVPAGAVLAHHSLANYDTTKAVRVKGTIVQFQELNPHSFIFLEQRDADGQVRRWAVEGPSIAQLKRTGFATHVLKPGTVVEVCGYLPKEPIVWQIASADPSTTSLAGRLLNGELMVMPDGREQSWGDYGAHRCFAPGHTDQHSK